MTYYIIKVAITTILIVAISEISKRNSFVAAILASVPLISVLAMTWLYVDTKDISKISALSTGVFWLVIPSLSLFIALPILLKQGVQFYLAMLVSISITIFCYWIMIMLLGHFNIRL